MVDNPNAPAHGRQTASVTESEDAVRNLKASESVTAAFNAAGVPNPPGDLANIVASYVKSATRDIPLNQIAYMTPGSGTLGTSAATGVTMFFNALTPAQRDAVKQGVNPLDPAAMMKFTAMINGTAAGGGIGGIREGGAGRATSETYTRELAGGSVFKALSTEGHSPAQINSAIDYARTLGTSEDMARKFIKLDKTSRDDLQTFVDDVRNDPALTDEQKAAKVTAFRKAHPKIGKTLTDQDVLKVIRGDDKQQIKLRGAETSVHEDSQEQKTADNLRVGVAQRTQAQHRADVASAEHTPDELKQNADELVALAGLAKNRKFAETRADASTKPDSHAVAEKTDPETSKTLAVPEKPRVVSAPAKSPSLA
jgi:hypothetical protein